MSAVGWVVLGYLGGIGTCFVAVYFGRKLAEHAPPTLDEVRAARDELTAALEEQEALEDAYLGAGLVAYPITLPMDGKPC